jgi:hypothetical protein
LVGVVGLSKGIPGVVPLLILLCGSGAASTIAA